MFCSLAAQLEISSVGSINTFATGGVYMAGLMFQDMAIGITIKTRLFLNDMTAK